METFICSITLIFFGYILGACLQPVFNRMHLKKYNKATGKYFVIKYDSFDWYWEEILKSTYSNRMREVYAATFLHTIYKLSPDLDSLLYHKIKYFESRTNVTDSKSFQELDMIVHSCVEKIYKDYENQITEGSK